MENDKKKQITEKKISFYIDFIIYKIRKKKKNRTIYIIFTSYYLII